MSSLPPAAQAERHSPSAVSERRSWVAAAAGCNATAAPADLDLPPSRLQRSCRRTHDGAGGHGDVGVHGVAEPGRRLHAPVLKGHRLLRALAGLGSILLYARTRKLSRRAPENGIVDFPVLVQAASVPVSPVVRNSSWKAAVPAAEHMIGAGTELLVRRDALLLALPAAGQSFLRDRLDTRLFPLN